MIIIIRKTTKGQFARDDPAFLVLLASTFAITTLSFGIMNGFPILKMLYLLLWFVCVDCVGLGILERAKQSRDGHFQKKNSKIKTNSSF